MEIKAAELCVLYREKYPQVFTQNCNHLHIYGKKHSRANAESGNDYLKIQMKHSKGLPNKQNLDGCDSAVTISSGCDIRS